MAKTKLTHTAMIISVIGGILMIAFGIMMVMLAYDIEVASINFHLVSASNTEQLLISGIISAIFGAVVIWVWKEKRPHRGNDQLIWGILFIVFGVIGLNLGSLILIIGGLLLIVDYF